MNSPKLFLIFVGVLLVLGFSGMASAYSADVAYIMSTPDKIKYTFTETLNEMGLTYNPIYYNDINTTNFSNYRMILLNDEYFENWKDIPINNVPALMVNGRNMENWGWTSRITISASDTIRNVRLNTTHEIRDDLPLTVPAYNMADRSIYFLGKYDKYNGLISVAQDTYDSRNVVIAAAEKGTILTKTGYANTTINARGVFFGIFESESNSHNDRYWTAETKQLFKNSIIWLIGGGGHSQTFDMQLKQGWNLISFPLQLESSDAAALIAANPQITAIKDYNGFFIDAITLQNNKCYFVRSSQNFTLTVSGYEITAPQNVVLQEGMNCVGVSSLQNIGLGTLPTGIIEVSRRANGDCNDFEISTKYSGTWNNNFPLEPGRGYWFKTNREVNWAYNQG